MKKTVIYLSLFLLAGISAIAQVSINTDDTQPDPSAMLDVKSSTKGFLPPRVALTATNVANPVVSPADGLLVYNTATAGNYPNNVVPGYYYWNGTNWTSLGLPAGTSGQTLRYDGSNWIANSVLKNDGTNIGIGTTVPSHKLTITGPAQTLRLIGPGTFGILAQLNFGDGDYVYISEDIDDKLLIHATGRTAITGGNVGIGTTTPEQKLTVAGTIETTSGGIKYPDGTTQTTAAAGNMHSIGESYGGGKVFYVYDGGQHGLIAATSDQSAGVVWWNTGDDGITGIYAINDEVNAGKNNTERIMTYSLGGWGTAAEYASLYQSSNFGDWYLPSKYELNLLYLQKAAVGGFANDYYWSSNINSVDPSSMLSWSQSFTNGVQVLFLGGVNNRVRAIRAF